MCHTNKVGEPSSAKQPEAVRCLQPARISTLGKISDRVVYICFLELAVEMVLRLCASLNSDFKRKSDSF